MKTFSKRLLTMLLAVAMVFSLSGMTTFAAETDDAAAQDAADADALSDAEETVEETEPEAVTEEGTGDVSGAENASDADAEAATLSAEEDGVVPLADGDSYDVKYAVSIYGINQDVDKNGNLLVTFGPATGARYADSYKTCGSATCIHNMSWDQIIAQCKEDPTVFQGCLENGCTTSVELNFNSTLGTGVSYNPDMDNGDGAGMLKQTIVNTYKKFNNSNSTAGGWPASRIRATLNGADELTDETVAGSDVLSTSNCLLSCFPENLQSAITAKAVKSDTDVDGTSNETTYDKLWLFSGKELYEDATGTNTNLVRANEGELSQRSQKLGISTSNYGDLKAYTESVYGSAEYWWLRSLNTSSALYQVNDAGKGYSCSANDTDSGIAFGFCIPGASSSSEPEPDTGDPDESTGINYAVKVYGINVDKYSTDGGATTETAPLTFGPALGADYTGSYVSRETVTAGGGSHDSTFCIHDMTWSQIIAQCETDPTVFSDCKTNGCTKAVALTPNDTLFNQTTVDNTIAKAYTGDGVSTLYNLINGTYAKWNSSTSENIYSKSRIRVTLNGDASLAGDAAGTDLCNADNCLLSCFPKNLQNAIVPRETVNAGTPSQGTTAGDATTYDKLFLLSLQEMGDTETYDDCGGEDYGVYKSGSRTPYEFSSSSASASSTYMWTRSRVSNSTSTAYYNDGYGRTYSVSNSLGLSPAFCIAGSSSSSSDEPDPEVVGGEVGVTPNSGVENGETISYNGDKITLTVSVDVTPDDAAVAFQWYKDGTAISKDAADPAAASASDDIRTLATTHTDTLELDGNVSDSGSYTCAVTVTSGDVSHTFTSDAFTITIEKATQKIAFTDETVEKQVGDDAFTNALTEDSVVFGDLTYTSGNEEVATVDKDGKVTIVGAGTTTITAAAAASDAGNYDAVSASYDLTVTEAEPETVKYAVSIWGIQQDTYKDDDGNTGTAGLTFGPATGANYVGSSKSHLTEEQVSNGAGYCIHWMTWDEIAQQSKTDPSVFNDCLENGCTKSVDISFGSSPLKGTTSYADMEGDGAGVLYGSLNSQYVLWNNTTGITGGWPKSFIRATLNGADEDTDSDLAGDVTPLTADESLFACFPKELQDVIVAKEVKSDTVLMDFTDNNVTTYDKLWLFSGKELYATSGGFFDYFVRDHEGERYQKSVNSGFTTASAASLASYDENGTATCWWMRSLAGYMEGFDWVGYVYSNGSPMGNTPNNTGTNRGLAPGFCLAGPAATEPEVTGLTITAAGLDEDNAKTYDGNGVSLTATVEPEDADVTYQWYKVEDGSDTKIDEATYTLYTTGSNVSDSGTYKCVATAGDGSSAEDTIVIMINQAKDEISYAESEVTVTTDDTVTNDLTVNDLYSKENGASIEYTSSNTEVATVDSDGKVTIVGAGETTITATAVETANFEKAEASYTLTVTEAEPKTVKYAVRIWGIGHDTYKDENGDIANAGLTFGPATGANYLNSYVSRETVGESNHPSTYCIHDMTWGEIIEQSAKDPSVFSDCKTNGCTKAVELTPNTTLFNMTTVSNAAAQNYKGDGVSALYYLLNGTGSSSDSHGAIWNYSRTNSSNSDPCNIYSRSRIRTTLTGDQENINEWMSTSGHNDYYGVSTLCNENDCLLSCFPQELQDAVVARTTENSGNTRSGYTSAGDVTTYDKLFLFSYNEVNLNSSSGPDDSGGSDYGIFTANEQRVAYEYSNANATGSTAVSWWMRGRDYASGSDAYAGYMLGMVSTSGSYYLRNPETVQGLAPGFALPGPAAEAPTVVDNKVDISSDFGGTLKAYDGAGVTLTATVEVTPEDAEVSFQWSKDGQPVDSTSVSPAAANASGGIRTLDDTATTHEDTLELAGNVSDSGTYTCEVSVTSGNETVTASGDFEITISPATNAISYETTEVTATTADETVSNELTVNELYKDETDAAITYASDNTEVAEVDASTGEVTLTGVAGTAVITATAAMTANFKKAEVSYTITVTEAETTAFAVYSETDNSLTFYMDTTVPKEGDTYKEKTATDVYVNVDKLNPSDAGSDPTFIPWYEHGQDTTIVEIDSSFKDARPINLDCWFYGFRDTLYFNGFDNLDTSNVTEMAKMFSECETMESVDVSNWEVSNVTLMYDMFYDCSNLKTIDVSKWDTSSVMTMENLFALCTSLKEVDVSKWDTSAVEFMHYTFFNCTALENVDVSNWETKNVVQMDNMFGFCESLTSLDLSHWNTSSLSNMFGEFQGCTNLTSLNISGWDTSSVENMQYVFYKCASLTSLDLSSWDTSSVPVTGSQFVGFAIECGSLEWVKIGENTDIFRKGAGSNTPVVDQQNWYDSETNGNVVSENYLMDVTEAGQYWTYTETAEPAVNYAVKIWGIQQDKYSEDGGKTFQTAGLTFGPATGTDYTDNYKAHLSKQEYDAGSNGVCIHWMSWDEIIAQSKEDPTVFEKCKEEGCTKAVELDINDTLGDETAINTYLEAGYSGDGVSTLYWLINKNDSLKWNTSYTGYSSDDPANVYSRSRIRTTLTGDQSNITAWMTKHPEANDYYGMDTLCDTSNCLFTCFPDELQEAIVPRITQNTGNVVTYKGYTTIEDQTTFDKLFLFSETEAGGDPSFDDSGGDDYGVNSSDSDRVAYEMSSSTNATPYKWGWWTRSRDLRYFHWAYGVKIDGTHNQTYVNTDYGLSPGFVLPGPVEGTVSIGDVEITAEGFDTDNTKTEDGNEVALSASVEDVDPADATVTYQWYKQNEDDVYKMITGETNEKLVLSGTVYDSGTYRCVVTATNDGAGATYSAEITITIKRESDAVQYAVKIWGIQTDTYLDEDSGKTKTAGLTFGPALGDNESGDGTGYFNTYKAHLTEEQYNDGDGYCIHWMTWDEIIQQSKEDPSVFNSCLENGCTKAVGLLLNETLGNQSIINKYLDNKYSGDGVSTLLYLLNADMRGWNQSYEGYSADDPATVYSRSRVRATLTGDGEDAKAQVAAGGNDYYGVDTLCDESNCLLSCFPTELQEAVVARTTENTGNATDTYDKSVKDKTTYDKLFLFSLREVGISSTYDDGGGDDYGVASDNSDRIAYGFSGTSVSTNEWWTRSQYLGDYYNVFGIESGNNGGRSRIAYVDGWNGPYGISPGFALPGPEEKEAFAVYTADDETLTFAYGVVPEVGDEYDNHTVTEVYTGFEDEVYEKTSSVPWRSHSSAVTNVVIDSSFKNVRPISLAFWFSGFQYASFTGLDNIDTSDVTTMFQTFTTCRSLASVDDLASWDTSAVTTMFGTFYNCSSLTNLDGLSNWDTSAVASLQSTFVGCSSLTSTEGISGWDTRNVTNMLETFRNCSSLEGLDISSWNTTTVLDERGAYIRFATGCDSLKWVKIGENTNIFRKGAGAEEAVVDQQNWYDSDTNGKLVSENYLMDVTEAGQYWTYTNEETVDVTITATPETKTYDGTGISLIATATGEFEDAEVSYLWYKVDEDETETQIDDAIYSMYTTGPNVTDSGTYKCVVTVTPEEGDPVSGSATITVTIDPSTQPIGFEHGYLSKEEYDEPFTNTLAGTSYGTITYTSSDEEVATVDPTTGEVTIKGVGYTVITATAAADEEHGDSPNYTENSADYILIVNTDAVEWEIDVNHEQVTWDEEKEEWVDDITYNGQDLELEMAINLSEEEVVAGAAISGYQWYRYVPENQDFEEIKGATDDTYTLSGDAVYAGDYLYMCVATVTYTTGITHTIYAPIEVIIEKVQQQLSYTDTEVAKITGDDSFTNSLTSSNISEESGGGITYTSSDTDVATVDETGEVTIVGAGETTITATAAETTNYAEASASYTLTVAEKLSLSVEVTSTLTDNEKTYDGVGVSLTATATVTPQDATLTYQWYKDDTAIDEATYPLLNIDGNVSDSGTYKCEVTASVDGQESVTESGEITITINAVDKTDLESVIEAADNLTETDYTPESWEALQTALAAAQAVYEDPNATESQVKDAEIDLLKAITDLVSAEKETVDKTDLLDAYVEASSLNEDDYSVDSWNELQRQLEAAQKVLLDPDATQAEVNQAYSNLLSAEWDLVSLVDLREAIAEAEALSAEDYTEASWTNLQDALAQAISFEEREDITEGEVLQALEDLNAAMDALVSVADLNKAIAEAEALNDEDYTADSWDALQTALQNAKDTEDTWGVDSDAINKALSELQSAIDNLVKAGDKTDLDSAIEEAEALAADTDDYTADSLQALEGAIEAAQSVADNPNATQDDVDKALQALDDAINGLVNIAGLNDTIEEAEELTSEENAGNYTTDSLQALKDEIDKAKTVATDPSATAEQVQEAEDALQSAIDNLVAAANKTVLEAAIKAAGDLIEDDYTQPTWEALQTALGAAKQADEDGNATQETVDDAAIALITAIANLESVGGPSVDTPDKSDLLDAYVEASKLDENDYTPESWVAMKEALEEAQSVLLDPNATADQVAAAEQALKDAESGLQPVEKADKEVLEAAIEAAQGLTESDYTSDSWDTLQTALDAAKEVYAKENPTQAEVNEATVTLVTAIAGLQYEEQPTETDADKSDLLDEYAADMNLDESDYTPETWEALQGALKEAEDVLLDPDATQKDVDAALAALQRAKKNLQSTTPEPAAPQYNGVVKGPDGVWGYYVDDALQSSYTGVAPVKNENGWWYIKNGLVDFSANTVAKNQNGWWLVEDGKVNFNYTGVSNYKNENGWWYIKDGKVDFTANTVAKNKNGWWYVIDGKVRFGFTGLANYKNENGWWYIKDGKVDFTHNGVDRNKNGWWYVLDGKVQFDFTGLADYKNVNGWWYINAGKVTFDYTGVATNKNGTWYVKDSKVDFSYNGSVSSGGSTYNVVNGKVS